MWLTTPLIISFVFLLFLLVDLLTVPQPPPISNRGSDERMRHSTRSSLIEEGMGVGQESRSAPSQPDKGVSGGVIRTPVSDGKMRHSARSLPIEGGMGVDQKSRSAPGQLTRMIPGIALSDPVSTKGEKAMPSWRDVEDGWDGEFDRAMSVGYVSVVESDEPSCDGDSILELDKPCNATSIAQHRDKLVSSVLHLTE
jgi:hypothetical protein